MAKKKANKNKKALKKSPLLAAMKKYQAGGLNQPASSMYGTASIPGHPETAALAYQEADPVKLKALEEELKTAKEDTSHLEEVQAEAKRQEKAFTAGERGVEYGLKAAKFLKEKAAKKTADAVVKQIVPEAATQGANIAGIGAGGVGAVASLAGEGIKMASDDQDATTVNVGEGIGSAVSGAGTGIGAAMTTAALMGSTLGPVGTAAGAIGGALYGVGKSLINRRKARRDEAAAEKKHKAKLGALSADRRMEALKSKEYSGYDFGVDLARNGGIRKRQTGGVDLPGGTVNRIPGSDAVEFKGASHENGGILLDRQTEVEDGETMDKVVMEKGGARDYFFSDHLKEGGKSYAQHHKDILAGGGNQKEINTLARMQEHAAGRNPGAVKEFQFGGADYSSPAEDELFGLSDISPEIGDTEKPQGAFDRVKDVYNKYVSDESKAGREKKRQERKVKRATDSMYKSTPPLAAAAGAAQLVPAAYAFLHKEKPQELMKTPGRLSAPDLERVNYNAERATNAAENRAMNRFIETSGGGPANIISKMASYRQKQKGDMQITSAETRANQAIANQEAQMQVQTDARNIANRMAVNQINTELKESQRVADENRKMEALDAVAKGAAGLAGDLLSYKTDQDQALALGDMGIHERRHLWSKLRGATNPKTGKKFTKKDIAALFEGGLSGQEILNKLDAENLNNTGK